LRRLKAQLEQFIAEFKRKNGGSFTNKLQEIAGSHQQ